MAETPRLQPVPDTLRPFDVFRMPVRFEEDRSRTRNHYVACIIINADGDSGVAVKLTSNPTWHGIGDIPLLDWRDAGLIHSTTARCSQLVPFTRTELQGHVGRLSVADAYRIINAVRSIPPEQRIIL